MLAFFLDFSVFYWGVLATIAFQFQVDNAILKIIVKRFIVLRLFWGIYSLLSGFGQNNRGYNITEDRFLLLQISSRLTKVLKQNKNTLLQMETILVVIF